MHVVVVYISAGHYQHDLETGCRKLARLASLSVSTFCGLSFGLQISGLGLYQSCAMILSGSQTHSSLEKSVLWQRDSALTLMMLCTSSHRWACKWRQAAGQVPCGISATILGRSEALSGVGVVDVVPWAGQRTLSYHAVDQ